MKACDLIKGIEEVFNPAMTYEGNYGFHLNLLFEVSKVKNGKNLVEEYFEKNYYKKIRESFNGAKFVQNPPLFLVSDLNGDYGRSLNVSLHLFIESMFFSLTGTNLHLDPLESLDLTIPNVVSLARDYRKKITLIQNGEKDVDIIDSLNNIYEMNEASRKILHGNDTIPLPYDYFLDVLKENITTFIVGLKYLVRNIKPIDLKELEACLDLDKFYLAMAKQLIEITKLTCEEDNLVHNSFSFVHRYVDVIEAIRSKEPYNLKTKVYLLNEEVIEYSVNDLIREYNEIKFKHPEARAYYVDINETDDFRNIEVAMELSKRIENMIASKELAASWDFISKGTRDVKKINKDGVVNQVPKMIKPKTLEEKQQLVNYRRDFLEETNYLYKIMGKNNFVGYVGYIYENGSVIFEKYYKKVDSLEPVDTNATYVMTFDNFVEMSKKTKVEIIDYIKSGGSNVKRLYHTSTWFERVLQIIESDTYSKDAMEKIDALLNNGEIIYKNYKN